MERICIGHSADTTDVDYLKELLNTGVYLSMDRYPGGPGRPDWRQRNATVKAMIDSGWAHRLMLGQDHAPGPVMAGRETPEAKRSGYLQLADVALPALRSDGVSDAEIDTMLRDVPREFLTGTKH